MKKNGKIFQNPILYLILMMIIITWFAIDIVKTNQAMVKVQLPSRDGWNFHFILDLGNENTWFSKEFLRGARERADQYGIALEIKDENSSYQKSNMSFINWACIANIDAVISIGESDADKEIIKKCLRQSTTECAIVLNDVDYGNEIYVGSDNYEEGYQLGKLLIEKYKGEDTEMVILYADIENKIEKSRIKGFHEALEGQKNIIIIDERCVESSVLDVIGQTEELLLANKNIQEIICFNETIMDGAVRGVIDLNRVKAVQVSGIGYSEEIQKYAENGIIDIAIDDSPYEMGKTTIDSLYERKKNKDAQEKKIITAYVIKKANGENQ